jgi:surface glycoprotein (TIGR04207 family)
MTETSSRRKQVRAALLSLVMVTSVFAGAAAMTGTVAAADANVSSSFIAGDGELVAGAQNQSIGTYQITDVGDGGDLGQETSINLPEGVTVNDSVSPGDLTTSGAVQVQEVRISGSQRRITFDHGGDVSATDESFTVNGLRVDVAPDTPAEFGGLNDSDTRIRVNFATNTQSSANNQDIAGLTIYKPGVTDGGSNTTVSAASSSQGSLDLEVDLPTNSSDAPEAFVENGSDIVVSLPAESNVTFDASQDLSETNDPTLRSSSLVEIDYENASVSADGTELGVPVTGYDGNDQNKDIPINGIAFNATPNAQTTEVNVSVTPDDGSAGVQAQEAFTADQITVQKPTVSFTDSVAGVGTFSQPINDVTVTSSTDGDIGNRTNVTLSLNNSALTFDQSADTNVTVGNNGQPSDTDNNKSVLVTPSEVTVQINSSNESDAGLEATDTVIFSGLRVNVTDDVSVDDDVAVVATTQSGVNSPEVTTQVAKIDIVTPDVVYTSDTVFVDDDGETATLNDITIDTTDIPGALGADTDVVVGVNRSAGVTFDTDATPTVSGLDSTQIAMGTSASANDNDTHRIKTVVGPDVAGSSLGAVEINYSAVGQNPADVSSVGQENVVDFGVDTNRDGSIDEPVDVGSASVSNGGETLTVGTSSSPTLSEGDVVFLAYNDVVDPNSGSPNDVAVSLNPGSSPVQNLTVTLDYEPQPRVTAFSGLTVGDAGTPQVSAGEVQVPVYEPTADGDTVTIENVGVSLTPDADDVRALVTTDGGNGAVTGEAPNPILVKEAAPDTIAVDANNDSTFNDDSVSVTVGDSQDSTIEVNSNDLSDGFGGAQVDLAIVESPSGSNANLNVTSATTNADGRFSYTLANATRTGDYVVNVNVSGATDVDRNVTYTVTAGAASQVNVTNEKDAVAGASGDVGTAFYEVRVEDSGGNINQADSLDFTLTLNGGSVDAVYDAYNVSNGTQGNQINPSSGVYTYAPGDDSNEPNSLGVFYVAVSGSGDITLTVNPAGGSVSEDSATSTFFSVDGVDIEFNKSEATVGEQFKTFATPTNAAGDDVTVPRVDVLLDAESPSVADFGSATTQLSTALNGTATAVTSANGVGDATIAGNSQNRGGSGTIAVVNATESASDVSVTAAPSTVDAASTHTVEVDVGSNSEGSSLSAVQVDYAVGNDSADVSNVGADDVLTVTKNGQNVSDDLSAVSTSNNGETVTFEFGGNEALNLSDTVVVEYRDVQNPSAANTSTVNVTVNPQSDPVDVSSTDVTYTEVEPASVTFDDKTVAGTNGSTVTVEETFLPEGGFVVLHNATELQNGEVVGSIVGNSEFLANGTSTNVTVTLTENVSSGTYVAMAHQDTNDNQTFDFQATNGSEDGAYVDNGSAVVDTANLTVAQPEPVEPATVTFDDKTVAGTNGSTVTVEETFLPEGGFVVLHNATELQNGEVVGSIVGNSEFLANGTSTNVTATLTENVSSGTYVAMAHQDTNDNQTFDFQTTNGSEDGAYVDNGSAVVDAANLTVEQAGNGSNPFPNGVPGVGSDSPADTDPADGFEDVNGDGTADFNDVLDFLFAQSDIASADLTQAQVDALDYDGNGEVDFNDVVELLFRLV